jgi:hypothetical protein
VAYRADIEIGVRGARDLEQLRSAINQTARAVDSLNEVVGQRGRLVQSIQNYTNSLDRATQSLKNVGAGTEAETKAIREYVQILGQATTARERQNGLIEEQIRLQQTAARTAKLSAGGVRENPNQYTGPIGPGAASPVALSSKLYGRLEQAIEAQVSSLTNAAKQLNLKSSWNTFFEEAAQVATELKQTAAAKQLNLKKNWGTFFEEATQVATELKQTTAAKELNLKSSWNRFFEEAAQVAEELKASAQRAAAEVRAREGAASAAARQRLAAAAAERREQQKPAAVATPQTTPAASKKTVELIDNSVALQKRYNNLLTSAQLIEQKALTYKAKGLQTDQVIINVQNGIQNLKENGLHVTKQYLDAVDNILNSLRNELRLRKAIADTQKATTPAVSVPTVSTPTKEPRQASTVSAQRGRQSSGLQNALIGGAFPLLFGGGAGTVVGGFAGGFIPGNPMMSVVTSALGAVLDQFAAQATELGKSLQDPIKNFDALKEANLLASSSQERYIQKLIESGKVAEAQAAIQAELFKKVSTQGVADLQNLGAASTKLSRAWAEFNLQLQTAIAGPMAGLLSWLASVINISNTATREAARQGNISQGLSATDKAALQKEEARILQGANIFNEAQKRQQVAELYSNYQSRAGTVSTGAGMSAASQETVQLEKAKTSELKAQVDLAAKQLSLAGVDVNINREGYSVRAKQVALQEYENKLLEIKNSFIGKAFDAERNTLMIREANLNYAAKLNNIDAQVRESAARAAKEAAEKRKREYQEQLDLVLQINSAKGELRKIQTDMVTYTKGEAEGLRVQAGFIQKELASKLIALNIEKEKALANTTSVYNSGLIVKLYNQQVTNAKQLAALETNKTVALANQVDLQEKLTRASNERAKGQQLSSLETQAQRLGINIANPFGGSAAEEASLLLDQQIRRTEVLGEVENKLITLQAQLEVAQTNLQDNAAQGYTEQIASEQAYLVYLTERLGILDQLEKKQLQQNQLMQQYGSIVTNELSTAMSSAVTAVVNGTGTVQEAFATMFQNIGKAFLDMATRMIAQALVMKVLGILMPGSNTPAATDPLANFNAGALQYRAAGGPVTGGSPYIVGERGPELFVPGRSGSIVPNNQLAGGGDTIVNGGINITVENTGESLGAEAQKQIARQVQGIVMGTLMNERRSGGMLR